MASLKAIIYTLICAVILGGCGDKSTNPEDWSWRAMSSGTTSYLQGVWGISASDVFAVGSDGVILHYDGSRWSSMNSGTSEWLEAIAGRSGTDVYVLCRYGGVLRYNGGWWNRIDDPDSSFQGSFWDVWTGDDQAVYAVGLSGVLKYSGGVWQEFSGGPGGLALCGVSTRIHPALSHTDFQLLVAEHNSLHYFIDGRWTRQVTGRTGARMVGIWTAPGSHVFAVGLDGKISRSEGSGLVIAASPSTQPLRSICGSSTSHIFAVGSGGVVAHFNGTDWTTMPTPTTVNLTGVWVSPNGEAFAVGYNGTILHYGP